jgi:predicted O-methyltransferase YrrM
MKSYADIIDLTQWIPDWHDQGACMDRRHILWLRYLLMQTKVQRTLEIGVHTGASASAFVAANIADAHFADLGFCLEARKVIGDHGTLHQRKGAEVLLAMPPFDLVLVDGNHSMEAVTEEIEALDANPPLIIVAHDVRSTAAGYPYCEGAAHLHQHLSDAGWLITIDAKDRVGEATKRGMLVATRDADIHQIATDTWLMTT